MHFLTILQPILTDDRVVALACFLITTIGGGLIAALIYIFKQLKNEVKDNKVLFENFTNELKYKFKGLNHFAKEADKKLAEHQIIINAFDKDLVAAKTRLVEISQTVAVHDNEIRNIKKTG